MALLQISEPGRAPDPHERRIAIGIDLGTTHSLVATVRHGVAECLPDEEARVMLPSVVQYLPKGKRAIGHKASDVSSADPQNTVASVKRLMGRTLADLQHAKRWSVQLIDLPGMVGIQTLEGVKTPVEVSAEILATLRQRAEDSLDDDITGAVITVPAYFDDAQRQATKDAAKLAGLEVLRLINEPTAAAIAYGLDQGSEGLFAVYDLGGGTFDISILRLSQGVFEVLSTGGDSALGGDDYDHGLSEWVLERANLALETPEDKSLMIKTSRAVKEQLSHVSSARFVLELSSGVIDLNVTLEDFEAITKTLTQKTLQACERALKDAKLKTKDLNGVVMVGGSTRMPQIQRSVEDWFGLAPLNNLNPDEVVALGAAIQANQLVGNHSGDELLLLDVTPLSLGIETMGGLVERIVPRNQTVPTAMAQDFTTYQDGQTALMLHVVQGERDLVSDCRSLARFELRGIPPMAAGAAKIRVTFTIDADGLLSVRAQELSTQVQAQIQVKPSYGLSDDQIAKMLQEGFETAEMDMKTRALKEAQVDADRILMATQNALDQDGSILDAAQKTEIERLMLSLKQASTSDSPSLIEEGIDRLAKGTEAFAAERMNQGILQALKGQNIENMK